MTQPTPDYEAIFTKPTAPRSDWEAFKWMFFEPSLLERFGKNISRRETSIRFLRVYFKFITLSVVLYWLLFITLSVCIDISTKHPEFFNFDRVVWISLNGFVEKWAFLAKGEIRYLAIGLLVGLVAGLSIISGSGINIGLALGWAMGLIITFGGRDFDKNSSNPFASIAIILAFGSVGNSLLSFIKISFGIINTSITEMIGKIFEKLLEIIFIFFIILFRLLTYPLYWPGIFKKYTLQNNPFLRDEGILLPLPWVEFALLRGAKENPALGLRFVEFLLQYRERQYDLAAKIENTAIAARWQGFLRLEADHFAKLPYFFREELPKNWEKWTPSPAWREKIKSLRDVLILAESQTAVLLKKDYLDECTILLYDFREIQLRETFKGRDLYFPVVEHWERILLNQLREVYQAVERFQSVSLNPYSKGNALSPSIPIRSSLFLEREDLRSELTLKIQTSPEMPTFLLLGQRRTGKTSLLNFLPHLLNHSRYAIAVLDAQSMSGELAISKWLTAWRDRVAAAFSLPDSLEPLSRDWLEAWDAFANFLNELAVNHQRKIILAMEEYDESQGFHNALRQDPERAAALLARIRAFSQRQNKVVLMFIGATDFIDLPGEPRWSKYFVQIHILRVEYLSRVGSLQLIERPIPDFRLRYAEGLPERIWELTQGHPHLLHSICSDLVDYANTVPKNPVDHADLDKILTEKTLQKGEQPFSNFWDEFCQSPSMREVVLAIAHHRPVDRSLPDVRRLLDYKYVVENPEGDLRMRVPLFEQWLLKFGY